MAATTGTVTYTCSDVGPTHTIYGNQNAPTYGMTRSGSFPSDNWEISSANIKFDVRSTGDYPFTVRKSSYTGTVIGTCSKTTGTGVQTRGFTAAEIEAKANFVGISTICLKGEGGNAFQINGGSSIVITVNWRLTTTACTAPTSVSCGSTLSEDDITLSWSGASGGTNNAITGYDIQYSDSSDGYTWGSWADYASVGTATSATVSPPADRGNYRRFRVRTKGSEGASWYSGYTNSSNSVRKNILPTAPGDVTISPSLYESGDITLSWTASTDSTNQVLGYSVQVRARADSGGSWSEWTDDGTTTSLSVIKSPTMVRGSQVQYRVCAFDDFNVSGAYSVSGEVTRNQIPTTPASMTSSVSVWESGAVALSWAASTDPDGNFDHYNIFVEVSSDGSSYGTKTLVGTSATNSLSVTPSSGYSRGDYIRYSVEAEDSLGAVSAASASVVIRRNTIPSDPTGFSVLPLLYESGSLTGSWTASADVVGVLSHYEIQKRTRANGGSYGEWVDDGTAATNSFTKTPTMERGSYIQYRIRAVDVLGVASGWVTATEVQRNMKLDPPDDLAINYELFETETLELTWTAPSDPNGTLDHYEVDYSLQNGSVWGPESVLASAVAQTSYQFSAAVLGASRGQYVRLMVRAWDSMGIPSDWEMLEIRRNSAPGAPAALNTDAPAIYESGPIVLTWPAGTDVDGNIAGYDVARMVGDSVPERDPAAGEIIDSVSALTATDTPAANRGQFIRYAVRTVDEKGVCSGWVLSSGTIRKNRLPAAPSLLYPVDGSVSWSDDPVFGAGVSMDDDGQTLTYEVRIVDDNETEVQGWTELLQDPSGNPASVRGGRIGLELAPGDYEVQIRVSDGLAYVTGTAKAFSVASPEWIRAISTGTVISESGSSVSGSTLPVDGGEVTGATLVMSSGTVSGSTLTVATSYLSHQADLVELLGVVNQRRAWFGLSEVSYATAIGYFVNWFPQMQQMAEALNACSALAGEPAIAISYDQTNYPTAAAINAVRNLAERL